MSDKRTLDDLGIVRETLKWRIKMRSAKGHGLTEAEKAELTQWRRELKAVERAIQQKNIPLPGF